jgi:hypothetical protein
LGSAKKVFSQMITDQFAKPAMRLAPTDNGAASLGECLVENCSGSIPKFSRDYLSSTFDRTFGGGRILNYGQQTLDVGAESEP